MCVFKMSRNGVIIEGKTKGRSRKRKYFNYFGFKMIMKLRLVAYRGEEQII